MNGNNRTGSRAAWARGFMALLAIILAMGLGLMASRAEAAPFAYVANGKDNTVSVIDMATHPPSVVATIPVGNNPQGVAVTPDGKHAYVTNESTTSGSVSVIRTATNTVVATIPVGAGAVAVAFTPDGTLAYVSSFFDHNISVIDTATKKVVATVTLPVKDGPQGIATTPNGKHAYVANNASPKVSNLSVIDTATNTVVATVPFPTPGDVPSEIAITPDGKHAYVTIDGETPPPIISKVSVIDTASSTVVATVPLPVGVSPLGSPSLRMGNMPMLRLTKNSPAAFR